MNQESKDLLTDRMLRSGIRSYTQLAKKVGIGTAAFSRRLTGVNEWKASEIAAISKVLNLTAAQTVTIFLR